MRYKIVDGTDENGKPKKFKIRLDDMKYIRTKDGKIYKTLEDYMQSDLPPTKMRVEDVAKGWHTIIPKSKIIKQADTIEELCDEFVYIMESGRHICKAKHTDIMYAFDNDKPIAYYGAIWTDKGLIYVAKMNEKGELELL